MKHRLAVSPRNRWWKIIALVLTVLSIIVTHREASASFVATTTPPFLRSASPSTFFQPPNVAEECSLTLLNALSIRNSLLSLQRRRPNQHQQQQQPRNRWTATTFLQATKKKSGSTSSSSTAATGSGSGSSKKVQVKLLKHQAGIGQAGDIVQVTPAFYQNKLRPSQAAVMVSDDQIHQERQKAKEQEEALRQLALAVKERFSSSNDDDDTDDTPKPMLRLSRKAGPGGQLFGGIGAKTILDELQHILTVENRTKEAQFLDQKMVKVTSITDVKGEKLEQIKHVGEKFVAKLALTKDVSFDLIISVEAEHS